MYCIMLLFYWLIYLYFIKVATNKFVTIKVMLRRATKVAIPHHNATFVAR